jgi:cytochrome c oxidase subunit 4
MESTTHGTSPGAGRMDEPEEPHGHTEAMPHHHVPYFMIFLVLVALTIITVLVALKRFDNELINLLLAMLVASIKAICVAMYFMHLKFEGKLIYLIMIVPLILCVILIAALIPDIAFALPFNRMTELPGQLPHGH